MDKNKIFIIHNLEQIASPLSIHLYYATQVRLNCQLKFRVLACYPFLLYSIINTKYCSVW